MCIWRNVHFQGGNSAADKPLQDDVNKEEELQNATEDNDKSGDDKELDKDVEQANDTRWYGKISSFFKHVL